jgi:hypothetical protein
MTFCNLKIKKIKSWSFRDHLAVNGIDKQTIITKWQRTGLLDGITGLIPEDSEEAKKIARMFGYKLT